MDCKDNGGLFVKITCIDRFISVVLKYEIVAIVQLINISEV